MLVSYIQVSILIIIYYNIRFFDSQDEKLLCYFLHICFKKQHLLTN